MSRPLLSEAGPRTFDVVDPGVCYRMTCTGVEVEFEADRLNWSRGEAMCELLVRTGLTGTDAIDGVLSVASFNLSSARARTERAQQLERQSRESGIPWAALLEAFCQKVLTAERTGDPAIPIRDITPIPSDQRIVRIAGFALPVNHPSIGFGDGGAAKTLLALYLAGKLSIEGYRVLVADWEMSPEDHRERYGNLFGVDMPPNVLYTRCSRPLIRDVDRIKQIIRRQGINFVVCDSIGFACHEAPESAVSALAYFGAVRQFNTGSFHVAHINRSESGDQKPFGSAFHHNSARATWFIKPTESATGLTLGIFNRKHNLTSKQQPFALDVSFSDGRTTIKSTEIAAVSELSGQLSASQRLRALLKGGSRTKEEIVAEIDTIQPESLRRTIDREVKAGRIVKFPTTSGEDHYGLATRAS